MFKRHHLKGVLKPLVGSIGVSLNLHLERRTLPRQTIGEECFRKPRDSSHHHGAADQRGANIFDYILPG
jgi:hypothetical protein